MGKCAPLLEVNKHDVETVWEGINVPLVTLEIIIIIIKSYLDT